MAKLQMTLDKLKELEEMTISIQPTDDNWETIKQYRKRNSNSITYYYLIRCKKCGNIQIATIGAIHNKKIKCETCSLQKRIGEIHGPFEIIAWDHDERGNIPSGRTLGKLQHYYKVRCTKCGSIQVKQYNPNAWRKQDKCINCGENRISTDETTSLNGLLGSYKDGAKARNLEWKLSNSEFVQLVTSDCFYCGQSPQIRKKYESKYRKNIPVNGIDRIDPTIGYNKNNCVPCCEMCNKMKLDYSKEQFLDKIFKIYNHSVVGSTTIESTSDDGSEQSTSQANGGGNGRSPEMENDIV